MRYLYHAFFTVILLGLCACGSNKAAYSQRKSLLVTKYNPIEVPKWLAEIPVDGLVIGIAFDNPNDPHDTETEAKEFAAISYSRCHSSFVVDKSAVISYAEEREKTKDEADFSVVVSSDPKFLNMAADYLVLLKHTSFHGYKVGLFGMIDNVIDESPRTFSASEMPDWCSGRDVYEEGEYVCIIGKAHEANLMHAWRQAEENALKKLAKYKIMNVIASLRSTEDWTKKMLIVETVTKSPVSSLSKSWFSHKSVGNASSYTVYLMLKSGR